MKKLLVITILMLTTSFVLTLDAQLKIKEYELGKVQKVSELNTLFLKQYYFQSSNLKDGRMSMLIAIPSDENGYERRVSASEIDLMIYGFQERFGVEFEHATYVGDDNSKDNMKYSAIFNGNAIIILINNFNKKPYEIKILFLNKTLYDLEVLESKEKMLGDI